MNLKKVTTQADLSSKFQFSTMASEGENRIKKNCTFEASQKSNFEDGTEALLGLEDIMTSH